MTTIQATRIAGQPDHGAGAAAMISTARCATAQSRRLVGRWSTAGAAATCSRWTIGP